MKKTFLSIALGLFSLSVLPSCGSGNSDSTATDSMVSMGTAGDTTMMNQLTDQEKNDGWQLLFDGNDLQGWHSYLKDSPGDAWQVQDGAIMLNPGQGKQGGDLTTNDEYQNYELSLQWKIAKEGNSGIIFNVHEDKKYNETYLTGPEMQVLDNKYASDNKKENHLAGSLYDLIAANPQDANPYGEWNDIKIKLDNGHLTFWMNGQQIVDTQMWDDQWKKLVQNSKFKQWPEFATFKTGHIALQDHGHQVWYRNIKIHQL